MARKQAKRLQAERDFHPYRRIYRLPRVVLESGWLVYDGPQGSAPHAGVNALLGVKGIDSVGLYRDRVTLLRSPEVSWEALVHAAEEILSAQFDGPLMIAEPEGEDASVKTGEAESGKQGEPAADAGHDQGS